MKKIILSLLLLPLLLQAETTIKTKEKITKKHNQTTRATLEGMAIGATSGYLAACTDSYWPFNWFATNSIRQSFVRALAEDENINKEIVNEAAYAVDWIAYFFTYAYYKHLLLKEI